MWVEWLREAFFMRLRLASRLAFRLALLMLLRDMRPVCIPPRLLVGKLLSESIAS
jgi:hypothetical protein